MGIKLLLEKLEDVSLIEGEVREIDIHPQTKKTLTLNIERPISFIG